MNSINIRLSSDKILGFGAARKKESHKVEKFSTELKSDKISFSGSTNALNKNELKTFEKEVINLFMNDMVPRLGIKNCPNLVMKSNIKDAKGSYSFIGNTIEMCQKVLTNPNELRVYGKQRKQTIPLVNKNLLEPLTFSDECSLEKSKQFVMAQNRLEDLESRPLTVQERKKLFIQRLFHEATHSSQYELQAKTQGIGVDRMIQKHFKEFGWFIRKMHKNTAESFWKDFRQYENTITKDSDLGKKAYKLFDADLNKSVGYRENYMEVDAYKSAYDYIVGTKGRWHGALP